MTFSLKRTENHNFTNNQYEPACGILSLFDILRIAGVFEMGDETMNEI